MVAPLEHEHGAPGAGEVGGGDEAVVAAADDHGVMARHGGGPRYSGARCGYPDRMARQDASHLFGDEHVRSYRETGGELGHDWKKGTSILLLTTKGRKSGQPRTTPLIYGTAGDDYVIVASKGGADEPPGWYVNLQAEPEVEVQVLDDRFTAHGPDGDAGGEAGAVGADGRRVARLRRLPGEHGPRDPGRGARAPLKRLSSRPC